MTRLLEVFSDQLEVIGLENCTLSTMSSDLLRRIEHKTLVDIRSSRLGHGLLLPNIRVCRYEATTFFPILRDLKNLRSAVSPKLLYLPSQLLQFLDTGTQTADDLKSFLTSCSARTIEVVFEEQFNERGVDSHFSQHFWRRTKE